VRLRVCVCACVLARPISESSKGVGPDNAAVTGRAIQAGGGGSVRRRRRRRRRRRGMGRRSLVVGGTGGTKVYKKSPGVTEVRTTAVCPGWVGFSRRAVRCGAVRCSRKVLATVAGCTRPREGRGRTIGPSCTSAQASLHDLQLRAWRETPRSEQPEVSSQQPASQPVRKGRLGSGSAVWVWVGSGSESGRG